MNAERQSQHLVPEANPLWNAQAHMPTVLHQRIVVERGEREYVYTRGGQRLFDGTSGLWFANIGHGRRDIAAVIAEQTQRLETFHVFGRFINDRAMEIAERLSELSPFADSRVILNSGGSDGIDLAAKLSRRYWQAVGQSERTLILSRESAYHGLHAYGTSLAGIEANREGYGATSLVPETARVDRDDIAVVAREIERIGGHRIAAFVLEPVVGAGGIYPPTPGYIDGVNSLARQHGFLVIADEVITGFGRLGEWFASTRVGLEPDIVVFAKGITAGYIPLGGLLISPRVWEPFYRDIDSPIFRFGSTYGGHATAAAVGLKVIDIVSSEGLLQRSHELEAAMAQQMGRLAREEGVVQTRSLGMMAGVQLHGRIKATQVVDDMLEQGQISRALPDNTVAFSPPLTSTFAQIEEFCAVLASTIQLN